MVTVGYGIVRADGSVATYGTPPITAGPRTPQAGVATAATPDGSGYWVASSAGGVFTFGTAGFYGSEGAHHLNQPIVGMAAAPDGHGYWLVARDGGIFAFGDAGFFGSHGGAPLNQPIIGMASAPDGRGYWLVAGDGGIFTYGDAPYRGSLPGSGITAGDVVGMFS